MECSAVDVSIVLHKVVLLDDPPARIQHVLRGIRVSFSNIAPLEQGTVAGYGIDLGTSQLSCGGNLVGTYAQILDPRKSMPLSQPAYDRLES